MWKNWRLKKSKNGHAYRQTGFSLVELLVVISIIGVLSAVLMANFMGARERARDAKKIEELGSLKNALRLYYNDNQAYPTPAAGNSLNDAAFSNYLPSISSVGYTYYQTNSGDGFNLCVGLDAGAGDDDINSQKKCGISPTNQICGLGVTTDKVFAVCAN